MGLIPSIQTVIGEKGYSQLETFAITYKMLRSFLGFLPVSDSYFLSLQLLKNRNEINSNFITAKNVSSKRFMYTALRHEFCTALHIFMKFSISEI